MHSSTNNHYLSEEFHDKFFVNDEDKHLLIQSHEEDDGNDIRGTKNSNNQKLKIFYLYLFIEMESGLAGLEIKGNVRTLSPVLFYQTNTRYLIMSNNELKYLPAGEEI
jgi:hypothetical protein